MNEAHQSVGSGFDSLIGIVHALDWYEDGMDVGRLQEALDEIFDHALVFHGYVDYMRDYELIVYLSADERSGIEPKYLRYLFKFCVEADAETALEAKIWSESLDERLTDLEAFNASDLAGYVWGVKWQGLYPGGKIIEESEKAQAWTEAVGVDFHEVVFETNGHNLRLVFSDLEVSEVRSGYSPYTVEDDSDAREERERLRWAKDQLISSVRVLATSPDGQLRHLADLGTPQLADELALDFNDAFVLLDQLVGRGYLTGDQARALVALDDQLKVMSGPENADLWRPDSVRDSPQWERVRMLANEARRVLEA